MQKMQSSSQDGQQADEHSFGSGYQSASSPSESHPSRRASSPRTLVRLALVVGVASALLSVGVGYLAYRSSRQRVLDVVAEQNLVTSRSIAEKAGTRLSINQHTDPLNIVEQVWAETVPPINGSYLCVIDANGRLASHSLKPKMVGTDVSGVVVEQRRGRERPRVADLNWKC